MEEQKLNKKKSQLLAKGNKNQLATVCNDLAELYNREGKYELSIQEYKQEAQIYNELGKWILYARANRMVGEIYTTLAEFEKALEHENIHLKTAREQKNDLEEQRALASLGRTHLTKSISDPENIDLNSLKLANKAFMQSLEICERLNNIGKMEQMDMRARLLLNIGVVQENQGDFEKGIEFMNGAIQICKTHEIYDQLHQGYCTLGLLYTKKRDYKKAITYFNLAVDVANRLSDKIPPMCSALTAKAEVLIKIADFQSAKHVLLKAYKLKSPNLEERKMIEHNLKVVAAMCKTEDQLLLISSTDYKNKKSLYEKMGDGSCDLKNYDKAIDYYKKMLECAELNGESSKQLIPVYVSLAQTYKDNKQYDLAFEYFQKDYAVSRGNDEESCNTLLNIAEILDLGKRPYEEILKVYNKARRHANSSGKMKLEGKVIKMIVNLQRKCEKFVEASTLEKELVMMDYCSSDSESEENISGTPDIGDDINIDDLSDPSDPDSEEELFQPRTVRKRGKSFAIKKNKKGETQLHTACIQGNIELARRLIEMGHVVNMRDNCGWLPIHEACNHGHFEIVKLLIDNDANINDRGGKLCDGITPLHDASSNGHLEIVELMLDRGASCLIQNNSGQTPLDMLKTWRGTTNLDAIQQTFYETLVARMTSVLEKAGRTIFNKPNPVNKENMNEQAVSRTRRSPRLTPLKQIGRRNIDIDTDDILEPIPSTSSCTRNLFRSNSSKFEEQEYDTSLKNNDSSDSDKESTSCNEYRRVMENLRKRDPDVKSKKSPKKARASAYLVGDDVGDDWLDDDIGINQSVKRRKTGNVKQNFFDSSGMRRTNSFNSNKSFTGSPSKFQNELIDDQNISLNFQTTSRHSDSVLINIEDNSNDSISSTFSNKRKNQMSLFESGFSRRRSDGYISTPAVTAVNKITNKTYKRQQKLNSFINSEPDSTSNVLDSSQFSTSTFSRSMLAINVRIEDKLWRIPVPANDVDNLTIGWLAKEAAKRYYSKEGISPSLQLETKEGAILDNDDPLSMVFMPQDEVHSTVISWNLPPLPERYIESCGNMKIAVNSKLREQLEECQATFNLKLINSTIEKCQFAPLFRSLNRQNNLQQIDLTSCELLNEGVHQLSSALLSLTQLRSLNLSLNNITSEGIRYISEIFENSSKSILEHLTELNLNFNPLGDNCLQHLSVILRKTKLKILNLSSCNLSDNIFDIVSNHGISLNFDNLEILDISYNELDTNSILKFISFLNYKIVTSLNLAHNSSVTEIGIAKKVAENLQNSVTHSIKFLNLARCNIEDSEVYDLLRSLLKAHDLDTLNLSYNSELTSVSLRRLMEHRPSFSNIILEGCTKIVQYLDQCPALTLSTNDIYQPNSLKSLKISVNYEKYPNEANILSEMWKREWGHRAKIEKFLGKFMSLSICD